jgi:hypothetical protein
VSGATPIVKWFKQNGYTDVLGCMRSYLLLLAITCVFLTSCISFKSLHSTTVIKSNDAFVLGNNEHGKFYVHVTNMSSGDLTIWQCPIFGGKHSPLVLKTMSQAKISVDQNTALRFENNNLGEATIQLKVKGDLGLSMGYSN